MAKPISKVEYPVVMSIVNSEYTDQLDQILAAQYNDDGSVVGVGQDGVKRIAFKISDDRIELRLLNPDRVKNVSVAQFSQEPDIPTQIADNLQSKGDPIFGGWLTQIQQMLETSDDLESAREALFQLYPDLDSTELTDQMTDAMALASMAGFWDAGTDTSDEAKS